IERLEREAFPALETEGHWRGMVTGSRPDGSTFPAELSLTIVGDGRLVCTVRDETERRQRERELELKERAMDEANVGIQITDPTKADNPLVYVNDGFERMTGYTREEALGRNPRFLQGEGTDSEQVARLRAAIAAEEPVSLELRNERRDGTPYWSRISITPVRDEHGSVQNYIGIQQDVTERKERERRLEARKDLLGRLYEMTTDPGLTFEEKLSELLEASRDYLDLPYGFLTRIETGDESVPGTQTIAEALGSHERLQPDESVPLAQSYCRETIERDDPMAITHAVEAGWVDDPAYEAFELETYVGAEVVAGEDLFGTLCFASKEPRDRSFDEFELSFIRLIGRWVGYEIDRRNAREELRQQRERLELTLSGTNTGIADWDLETDAVTWNGTLVDIVGQEITSIEGFRAAVHPEDRKRVQRELEAMLETGDPWVGEFRMLDGNGNTLWLGTRATPVYDDEKEPVRVLATGTDISKRRERERELELKERAMNEANIGITISDPDQEDNPLVYVNDGFVDQTGYTRADAVGRNCRFLQADDRDQTALDDLREAIAAEEATTVELRNYRKDGEQFWNRLSVTPVYDEDGELTNHIGIQQDITEQKTREKRLRVLHGTTRELLQTDGTADAAAVTVETLTEELGFHLAGVYLRQGDELVRTATTEKPDRSAPERVERGRTPLWKAVEAGEPVYHEDSTDIDDDVDRGETVASAYFPIGDHGAAVVGVTDPDRLNEGDRRLIEVLTGNLVAVFDRFEQEASLRASERRYRSLAENIPNGAVLTFDENLEYSLAAGELLSEVGLEASGVTGMTAGTVLPDIDANGELVSQLQAALDGERTNRRVEVDDRTLRVHIVPVDADAGESDGDRGLVLTQDVTEEAQREQDLFEERERFRLLAESVDEYAFLIVDEEGVIQTWNEGAEDTFGYDAEAAIGMGIAELHPEADRESGLPGRLLQQARIAGESAHEGWRVRADGSEFYADIRHAPLEDDNSEFRGYAVIVRDMTDRRRQQRRTERFVEESDDVVTIVDTDGTITYASGSADRVLGHDPDHLVGENLFDYLHPDSREATMETFFTGMEDPEANLQAECRLRSGDGEWRNVEGQYRNMLDDDAIDGMLLYLRDVTDRKERSRRFESIFNQTFQFTGLLEPDGTVVEVNNAALEFGGIERDDIVGDPFSDAPWWTHSEAVRDNLLDALERGANGELVRYETEVRGADGLATIDFSVKPVTDEDDEVSLLVVEGRDITTQVQDRRHLEVMQRVMRHNMRNDLTKVRGWTEVMSEETDAEKRAEQFETVERILDKWGSMTEKMGEIREIISSQKGQGTTTEAKSLVEDAVAPIREEYPDMTVVTDISDNESGEVPRTLHEAVHELVENAAKVNSDSTVEVELTRPGSDWIAISVRDNGPGMPEMEASVLETGEETPLNHGQGLGLWMVRMIVTGVGGDVSVETTDDGTEVCLRVPTSQTVEREPSVETPR
uniref:PAS domain S-box protein n=1 Tax=Halorientalis sp. TaxID=1931229 RepID=UPI002612E6A2